MADKAPTIFVIGTVSLDVLHLADGRTVRTAGGAGLYTALAAYKAGATVGLFAPKPQPLPVQLQSADECLYWLGPAIAAADTPRLEIVHHGGGKATLLDVAWGAELQLTSALLPDEVVTARYVHIAALSSAQRQLDFLQALRGQPPLISVGTYARLVYNDTERVRQLFEQADLFFMNENEAKGLFGAVTQAKTRPGALLFVTLDAEGALVVTGEGVRHVPGEPVAEIDPTGAGDTFCGATLTGLLLGLSPVEAARRAVKLAAQTVGGVGPAALW